jgi:hypothetical protein
MDNSKWGMFGTALGLSILVPAVFIVMPTRLLIGIVALAELVTLISLGYLLFPYAKRLFRNWPLWAHYASFALAGLLLSLLVVANWWLFQLRSDDGTLDPLLLERVVHMSISPNDPRKEVGLPWPEYFAPLSVYVEPPAYQEIQTASALGAAPDTETLETYEVYETCHPDIEMFISNDYPPDTPTVIIDRLELDITEILPLEELKLLRYTSGGPTLEYKGGYVAYKTKLGRYPVQIRDTIAEVLVANPDRPDVYLTLGPTEVEGLKIAIEPEDQADPGIYVMQFAATIKVAGKTSEVYSDKVFRCAHPAVEPAINYDEYVDQWTVEDLRQQAYFDRGSHQLTDRTQ